MAELTWWSFIAFGLLPLPIVLIVILSSPAPRDVRKGVLWFVQQVLSFDIRPPFQVMHVALLMTGFSFLASVSKAIDHAQQVDALENQKDANVVALMLVKKFRAERNAWLSAFSFASWAMLLVTHRVNKEKHELRGKLLALQGRPAEAAQEIGFLGARREQEMREMGQAAAAAAAAQGRVKGGSQGVAAVAAEPAPQGLVGKQGPAAPMVLQGLKKEL